MGKLTVFDFVTLNGFFEGENKDITWHTHGPEETEYSAEMLQLGNTILFGRLTYELMAGYWPTPLAAEKDPEIAEGMNKAEKIVFSRTLKKATWNNTRLVKENMEEEIKKLKLRSGKDMTLLGSGNILAQLAEAGLIDEYQLMLDPLALSAGTPLFKSLRQNLKLKLKGTRVFKSGSILLYYEPVK